MGRCLRVLCGFSRTLVGHDVAVPFSFRTSASNQEHGDGLLKMDDGRPPPRPLGTAEGIAKSGEDRETAAKIFLIKPGFFS